MRHRPGGRPTALRRGLKMAVLAALLAGCGEGRKVPERPNVLVILVDALRGDRLGVNDYPRPTTPNLDRLAAEGATFRSAFSHSTWTKPAVATLLTSLYPSQHGVLHVGVGEGDELHGEVLADELTTLAESFRAGGYQTAAVVNQVHLDSRFGFGQGFDLYLSLRGKGAYGINGRLRLWLEESDGRPFFAYLHYLDVHWPYTKGRREHQEALGPVEMKREPPQRGDRAARWAEQGIDAGDLAALANRYDCEVAFIDDAIGSLMDDLRALGLYEETLVLVTSDHGEGFLEHGSLQHGYAPYEEVIRVPLVLRLPAALRPRVGVVDRPVGLVDVMPTLLELAGLGAANGLAGESLVPLLRGERSGDRLLFAETAAALAVRGQSGKLMDFGDDDLRYYDLTVDPGEQRPVIGECVGRCMELASGLADFRAAMTAARAAAVGRTEKLTPEEIERLKALGYL